MDSFQKLEIINHLERGHDRELKVAWEGRLGEEMIETTVPDHEALAMHHGSKGQG
jgi:hypothetical protein